MPFVHQKKRRKFTLLCNTTLVIHAVIIFLIFVLLFELIFNGITIHNTCYCGSCLSITSLYYQCLISIPEPEANSDEVLNKANAMLQSKHSITQSTLQVEGYQQVMGECGTCQEPQRTSFFHSLVSSFRNRRNS